MSDRGWILSSDHSRWVDREDVPVNFVVDPTETFVQVDCFKKDEIRVNLFLDVCDGYYGAIQAVVKYVRIDTSCERGALFMKYLVKLCGMSESEGCRHVVNLGGDGSG